jgi:hypothetical protein
MSASFIFYAMTDSRDPSTSSNAKSQFRSLGRTRAKWLMAGFAVVFVVIQFFGPERTNPPVVESHTMRSQRQIPPRMADLMNRACMDCHSHETRWPWYSGVAPVRWWLVNHVNDGRRALNFSEWTQYQPTFAAATLGSMGDAVKKGVMPPASYRSLHPEARLTDEEVKEFSEWAQSERTRMLEELKAPK